MALPRQPDSLRDVVENGLCIGCGLCEAMAPERWCMTMTPEGRLRPAPLAPEDATDDAPILAACPGAVAKATPRGTQNDELWGSYTRMSVAWSADPDVRFRAATGGVLTALGMHLLRLGKARFILHCAADESAPLRTRWVISETPEDVAARCGSRYGPSDTLAGLEAALVRDEPFAVIAKPCDAGALRSRAEADPRLARRLVAVLVMVCGGASDLGKSWEVLRAVDVAERDVTLFRYRGHGNPGPTRIETRDGRAFEKTYNEMWEDESGWRIQTRCKLCPDAIGEAADIAAADIWPGAVPDGEDDGFNGVILRTPEGDALWHSALEAGELSEGDTMHPRDFDRVQPHQVSKKRALAARLRGLVAAGKPVFAHEGLRLDALDGHDPDEEAGALRRARTGRFDEDMPT